MPLVSLFNSAILLCFNSRPWYWSKACTERGRWKSLCKFSSWIACWKDIFVHNKGEEFRKLQLWHQLIPQILPKKISSTISNDRGLWGGQTYVNIEELNYIPPLKWSFICQNWKSPIPSPIPIIFSHTKLTQGRSILLKNIWRVFRRRASLCVDRLMTPRPPFFLLADNWPALGGFFELSFPFGSATRKIRI